MYITQQPTSTAVLQEAGVNAGVQQGSETCSARAVKFTTTQSFTTTHGFFVSTPPVSCPEPVPGGSNSSCSTSSCGTAVNKEQATSAQPSTPVGWSGLLEISRLAGGPGLVGSTAVRGEEELGDQGHVEVACTAHASTGVRRLVKSVIRGLKARQEPEAAREGMGGTYFFTNEMGRKVAIFKPCDEEPLAPANPKGYVGRNLGDPGWKSTVRVGEAAIREVAAYLLDHDHYAQVPHTVLVQSRHPVFNYNYAAVGNNSNSSGMNARSGSAISMASAASESSAAAVGSDSSSGGRPLKLGSLQEFVYHIADTSDFGASRFRTRDVHAIGILDLRLFNTDRHAGNILVRQPQLVGSCRDLSAFTGGSRTLGTRPPSLINASAVAAAVASGEYELIPIDHGFCLPEALEAPYFEWLHWPQACLPFSEEELAYIARLDIAADIALLQRELPNLRPECVRVMEVSTTLLQKCAAAGLSLADIGALASRPLDALDGDDSCPSELEKACIAARQAVDASRELVMSSSLSDDADFTLLEEAEEDLIDSEDELEPQEQQHSTSGSPMLLGEQNLQQRPHSTSRLVASEAVNAGAGLGRQQLLLSQPQLAVAAKVSSTDLASVTSDVTVCKLDTAMSLGSRAPGTADGDLLFDLDDDSGSGSSAVTTPVIGNTRCISGSSPLGRGVPAAAGEEDVDMAAASSLHDTLQAEALSKYMTSVQLLPADSPVAMDTVPAPAPSPTAAAGRGSSGLLPVGSDAGSGEFSLPMQSLAHTLSTPVGSKDLACARSMQVGSDAWMMLRDIKAKAGLAATVNRVGGPKKGSAAAAAAARRRTGIHRAIYPPPVGRAPPPRATKEVLSGLSEAQWRDFMDELRAYMDAALRPGSGDWRRASQAAGLGAAAMSCPRF